MVTERLSGGSKISLLDPTAKGFIVKRFTITYPALVAHTKSVSSLHVQGVTVGNTCSRYTSKFSCSLRKTLLKMSLQRITVDVKKMSSLTSRLKTYAFTFAFISSTSLDVVPP